MSKTAMYSRHEVLKATNPDGSDDVLVITISVCADESMDVHQVGVAVGQCAYDFVAAVHTDAHPDNPHEIDSCDWTPLGDTE